MATTKTGLPVPKPAIFNLVEVKQIMELYEYGFDHVGQFKTKVLEGFEEKEKVFMRKHDYPRQIKKNEIGCPKKDFGPIHCYLTEKDDEKAKDLIRSYINTMLSSENERHKKECEYINKLMKSII